MVKEQVNCCCGQVFWMTTMAIMSLATKSTAGSLESLHDVKPSVGLCMQYKSHGVLRKTVLYCFGTVW